MKNHETNSLEIMSDEDDYLQKLDDEFIGIIKKRSKLYFSTPQRHINYSQKTIKYFKKKLTEDIALFIQEQNEFLVDIFIIGAIIKISVAKTYVKNDDVKQKMIYLGVLFPWRMNKTQVENCLLLPFLLCQGPQKIINMVNDLLSQYFECVFSPLVFHQQEFKWFIPFLLQNVNENNEKLIQLVYQWESVDLKFDLYMHVKSCLTVWKEIHHQTSRFIKKEEVDKFYSILKTHLKKCFKLDVDHFQLKSIIIKGCVHIDVSGKIQVSQPELFDCLLRIVAPRITLSSE